MLQYAVYLLAMIVSLAVVCTRLAADEAISRGARGGRDLADAVTTVHDVFGRYCFDCHARDTQEANIRLDTLDYLFNTSNDYETWRRVLKVLESGKMPPEDVAAPTPDERMLLSSWLVGELASVAQRSRRAGNSTRNRRLTVEEYNFTMQSLFGVNAQFASNLPADPISSRGFHNDSALLGLSPLQIECYLDNARQAVQRYIQFGSPDEQPIRYFVEFESQYYSTADRYRTRRLAPRPISLNELRRLRTKNRNSTPAYVGPLSPIPPGPYPTIEALRWSLPKLHQQFLAIPRSPSRGDMIIRVRAAATPDRNGKYPRMRVEAGITLGDGDAMDKRSLGEVDVRASRDEPAIYEFHARVEDIPTKGRLSDEEAFDRLSVYDMDQFFISNITRDQQAIYALGAGAYEDPHDPPAEVIVHRQQMAEAGCGFLYLDSIEIQLLPSSGIQPSSRWAVAAPRAQRNEAAEYDVAHQFLKRFMSRAYRRPVTSAELEIKLQLFDSLRDSNYSFENSLRETAAAVLVSPSFLFLEMDGAEQVSDKTEMPTPHTLASRLSYLLWLTAPDERLMHLADERTLLDPEVYSQQAARLLDDPRSRRFLEDFCRQWLRLDKLRLIAIDSRHHPSYDEDLADATIAETLNCFVHVFRSGANALELIDADYTFLNDRLARHYGLDNQLPSPLGGDLMQVRLPEDSRRGGLLTQASVLTMNSDGVDSHPIRRGVWVLDRLLNSPPPPPPPNVPEIEEDAPRFRGLSLRERIQLHRQPGSCRTCHQQIDPWGIALENFDAVGRWHDTRRIRNKPTAKPGVDAQPINVSVRLPKGPRVASVDELKRYVGQKRKEQFTRAIVHHMLTYALGRSLDVADRPRVDAIYQRFAASGYRLRDLVLAIVEDPVFRL